MSRRLTAINIILVITDLILSAMTVAGFAWAAFFFAKWWLILFTLFPLALYSHHSIIIESDIQQNQLDQLHGRGENDSDQEQQTR